MEVELDTIYEVQTDVLHPKALFEQIVRRIVIRNLAPCPAIDAGVRAVESLAGIGFWRDAESCRDGGNVHVVHRDTGDRCLFCGRFFWVQTPTSAPRIEAHEEPNC